MIGRLAILCNPTAGSGRALAAARAVRGMIESHGGIEVRLVETESPEHMLEAAREAARRDDALAVAGGDGSVLQAVNGLDRYDKPVAVIPAGTANVLARQLRVGLNPQEAAATILRGRAAPMDVLETNDRLVLLMVGVGLDAEVVHHIHEHRTDGDLKLIDYLKPMLQAVLGWRTRDVEVRLDGRLIARRADHVLIANTRLYGGPFAIATRARHDDGLLDVVVSRCRNRLGLLATMAGAAAGMQQGLRTMRTYRGRHVTVSAPEPVPVQTDGDPAGTTPIDIAIRPHRLLVLC